MEAVSDVATRIATATASGDVAGLSALAIELAQENSRLAGHASALEHHEAERKAAQAARKRRQRHGTSQDVAGQGGTERDGMGPPPPQVSPSFPTPLITPSFPPAPLPPQAPQGEEEEKLHDRAPEAWPVIVRFLEGKEAVARRAWIGRFHGALDRPPHPTGAELRDALEDLMTAPRESWNPALFRRYVERIRRDAERGTERTAKPQGGASVAAEAGWEVVVSMIPAWNRREVTAEIHAALPEGIRRGLSKIGGFRVLAETPDAQRVWKKKEFVAAFQQSPSHAGAA